MSERTAIDKLNTLFKEEREIYDFNNEKPDRKIIQIGQDSYSFSIDCGFTAVSDDSPAFIMLKAPKSISKKIKLKNVKEYVGRYFISQKDADDILKGEYCLIDEIKKDFKSRVLTSMTNEAEGIFPTFNVQHSNPVRLLDDHSGYEIRAYARLGEKAE